MRVDFEGSGQGGPGRWARTAWGCPASPRSWASARLTLGVGLGGSGRLTYHEAIWAQSAREMIADGSPLVPTLDGRPWLEKPPLGTWLIALSGRVAGGIDEGIARGPSAVAATLLALAVATLAAGRFGAGAGLLAGLVQATTLWTVMRGRLAEADILLAALVAWAIAAFDRVRAGARRAGDGPSSGSSARRPWRKGSGSAGRWSSRWWRSC